MLESWRSEVNFFSCEFFKTEKGFVFSSFEKVDRESGTSKMDSARRRSRRLDFRQNLFRIPSNITISFGLQWNFVGAEPVDLDVSCVAFAENGRGEDVIFYNNLSCEGPNGTYMIHSGDNTTGEDDGQNDDETITFDMSKIPDTVHYLMICVTSYTGADFTLVEHAKCRLRNLSTNEEVGQFQLGVLGRHTATLICAVSRNTGNDGVTQWWDMLELGIPLNGYTFVDLLPVMQDLMNIPQEDRRTLASHLPNYEFVKEKNEKTAKLILPSQMKFCIGWDGENDLDCFLIMLDDKGEYVDHVYAKHGKIKSKDGAAVHSGDKLNGFAGDGDDEYINVDANKLRKDVHQVYFCVTLYSGFASSFGAVPNSFARMQNHAPKEAQLEVDRFSLTRNGGANVAVVFSALIRRDSSHFDYARLNVLHPTARDWIDLLPMIRSMSRVLTQLYRSVRSGAELPEGQAALTREEECNTLTQRWSETWPQVRKEREGKFAIAVEFLSVRDLGPLEPHHFAAHCEAWVCDRKSKDRAAKTEICFERDNITWSAEDPRNRCVLLASRFDRIRVMVYEHAVVGFVDLELSELNHLFEGDTLEEWFPLKGKDVNGEVRLRVRHVPLQYAPGYREEQSWCSVM